jgi:glycosyltransferase involved in cell wall biosynthesis
MRLAIIYLGFNNPRKHKRGVENVIEIQAKSLGSSCRKYYIFFDTESSTSRWGDITAIGVRYSLLRFLRTNLIIWRLRRRLRRRGYRALVHSHHYLTATFLWWMTDVFSVHDGLWYQKRMVGSRIPWFFFLVEKWVYWRARNLQCNSGFTLKNSLLVETGREVRIVFCSTPLERNRQLGLDKPLRPVAQGETMVFSVRSIEKRARIDLILDVADRANQRGLHLVFLIAGTGPLFHEYCQQVQERGLQNVRLLGYVAERDLARMYAGSDIVLMLCEYGEGFGIPAIEGYLFGKPVIASNRCAVPEVLISSRSLVENEAEEVLQRLLETAAERPDPEALTAYYENRFSNKIITAQFREMYDSVCRTRFRRGYGADEQ